MNVFRTTNDLDQVRELQRTHASSRFRFGRAPMRRSRMKQSTSLDPVCKEAWQLGSSDDVLYSNEVFDGQRICSSSSSLTVVV